MSRKVDVTKPLDEFEKAYLAQRGKDHLLAQAESLSNAKTAPAAQPTAAPAPKKAEPKVEAEKPSEPETSAEDAE